MQGTASDLSLSELFDAARENTNLSYTDFCTINDLLDRSGYRDAAPLSVLLLCLFLALEEGSLCVAATDESIAHRLRDLLDDEQALAWAGLILSECTPDLVPNLIGSGPDDNRPVVLFQAGNRSFYYFQRYLRHELVFCEHLTQRLKAAAPGSEARQAGATLGAGPVLDAQQRAAVELSLTRRLAIISGGPGTGKTSIVVALLRELVQRGCAPERIALAAPTGRAAQRLTDAIRHGLSGLPENCSLAEQQLKLLEAHTLHHLLRYSPSRGNFMCHAENPVPADVVIVDEASMVGIGLMAQLLQATRPETRLIILGDKDQLPSVDAGAVLASLLEGEVGGVLRDRVALLETNYRSQPAIRVAAAAINEQRVDALEALPPLDVTALADDVEVAVGCCFLPLSETSIRPWHGIVRAWAERHYLRTAFKELATKTWPFAASQDLDDLFRLLNRARLLTVLREGPYGCIAINESVDELLRPHFDRGARGRFFAGATLLITRNDYSRKLFNGDVGVLLKDVSGSYHAVFSRPEGPISIPAESLPAHELGFAITVHKSQGSEYDEVLLALPPVGGQRLLTKEILYTGITRARRLAVVCGTKEVLQEAIGRRIHREAGLISSLARS